MKYERDVCFQYTGEDSVPADIKDLIHYDGTNLIIDNKAACLGWYVAYNKLSADVVDMDSLIIRSADEWKKKMLFDVESASSGATVATPKFAPVGGNIDKYGKVTITCSTDGATIYYTDDNTDPSKDNGTLYNEGDEIEITTNVTLKAIAYGTDEEGNEIVSSIASATYNVVMPTCATPKASATGSVPIGTKVTLSCDTPDAEIYYTIDGTVPANGVGTLYADEEIPVTNGMTLKAIAVKADYNDSAVFSTKYTVVKPTVDKPTVSPTGSSVQVGTTLTLACSTNDATIYYTTDGSIPSSTNGTEYTNEQIPVVDGMTLKAIAVKDDWNDSPILSVTYTVTMPTVDKPVITPASGEVESGTKVTITCTTDDATIYYTTDDSTPSSTNGTEYTTEIEVTSPMTIKAIAVKADHNDSAVASASYTVKAPVLKFYAGMWNCQSEEDDSMEDPITMDTLRNLTSLVSEDAVVKEYPASGVETGFGPWDQDYGSRIVYAYPKSLGEITMFSTNGTTGNMEQSFTKTVITDENGNEYNVWWLTDISAPSSNVMYKFY